MAYLDLQDLRKQFGTYTALGGISVSLAEGEFLSLLGPSGCGKTTALRIIAGFLQPDSGRVVINGEDMTARAPNRRDIGMVFQAYSLFPNMTAAQNVAFGLKVRKWPSAKRDARVSELLEIVGLSHAVGRYPHQLSGGMQQRVALARALAIEPRVLLLDEPLSALDALVRVQLREEIRRVQSQLGITTVYVTHDQEEALSLADRLAVMRDGQIVQVGPPVEVYGSPATRWAAQFVGEVNVLSGVARGDGVETELGVFDLSAPASGEVHVAVRPEQLELSARGAGNAEVIAREFRGHDVLYRLRHEGGKTLLVQLPSLELHEVGDAVFVRPAPAARTCALVD